MSIRIIVKVGKDFLEGRFRGYKVDEVYLCLFKIFYFLDV